MVRGVGRFIRVRLPMNYTLALTAFRPHAPSSRGMQSETSMGVFGQIGNALKAPVKAVNKPIQKMGSAISKHRE